MPLLSKCFKSSDPEKNASKAIDKMINEWMKRYNKFIKILLLGAGESGKTTIIKQMKILHIEGFSEEERKSKIHQIRCNILEAIQDITKNMSKLEPAVHLADEKNMKSLEYVQNIKNSMDTNIFTEELYHHIKSLWSDDGIQKSFRRSNEYALIDCAKYFLERIDEIKQDEYIPNDQDMLRCRQRTSDIQKIEFEVKLPLKYGGGVQTFWMFDVGGQKGERRKWIQVFDGISAVLFIVATSGFDIRLREDNNITQLDEALKLFEEVWSSRFLRDSGFILFLNKQDILKEKIERGVNLGDFYSDYLNYKLSKEDDESDSDDDNCKFNFEYKKTRAYIKDKFITITRKKIEHRIIDDDINWNNNKRSNSGCFWHYTTATDTNNISKVFQDIHTMIIIWNLKKLSLT